MEQKFYVITIWADGRREKSSCTWSESEAQSIVDQGNRNAEQKGLRTRYVIEPAR